MRFKKITFLISVLTTLFLAQTTHADLASQKAKLIFENAVETDLLAKWKNDVYKKSDAQISEQNKSMFRTLSDYKPRTGVGRRLDGISKETADLVLSSINQHPVVSEYNLFDRKNGMSIGFCFGRATYVHLTLLRMGLNKDAIKKIWAVGPMNAGGITWQFHVATIAKLDTGKWIVIDTYVQQTMSPEDWFKKLRATGNSKLRFYVSNPEKFSISLGEYSRVQMGLDLDADQDWYSHYFKDLMTWMGTKPLSDVGLHDLRPTK